MRAACCEATVLRHEVIADDIRLLTALWPDREHAPHAGQFFTLRAWGADEAPFLSRPISVHKWDAETQTVEFLYAVVGEGTRKLTALKKGDSFQLTGPMGNGFDVADILSKYQKIAVVGGGIGTAFHLAVEAVTELRGAHGWLLWLLPVAGLAIVALYKVTGCEGMGTNNVIRAVHSGESVSPLLVPAIFFGTVLTHLCGGSAGREGAALQMGGSIGYNIAKLFRFSDHDRRTATACGMAAFFSALFGTPLSATLFGIMVEDVGLAFSVAFVPGFAAALIAYGVSCRRGRCCRGGPLLPDGRGPLQRRGHGRHHCRRGAGAGPAVGLYLQDTADRPDPLGGLQGRRGRPQLLHRCDLRLCIRPAAGPARRVLRRRGPRLGVLRRDEHPHPLHPAGL